MCKNGCVQSYIHFLAVLIMITFCLPLLPPKLGVKLEQNALFSLDIPDYNLKAIGDVKVQSEVGIYQVNTGLILGAQQTTSLQDLTCTDDWIACTDLQILRFCLYFSLGFSVLCVITSCCQCYKFFGVNAVFLIIAVAGAMVTATKITSGVAQEIHSEVDALSFVCETSGFESGVSCIANFAKEMIHKETSHSIPTISGLEFDLSNGIKIYVSYALLGLCASSAILIISAAVLFVMYFLTGIICCGCCRRRREDYVEFGSVNNVMTVV